METQAHRNAPCFLLITILFFFILGSGGCQTQRDSFERQFLILFEGFQLSVVDDLPAKTPIPELYKLIFSKSHPTQPGFVPGRVYLFIKTNPHSNEELGMSVLPKRLEKMGASVIEHPRSEKDFMYLFLGGPLYVIKFKFNEHSGTIFNRVVSIGETDSEELIFAYQ